MRPAPAQAKMAKPKYGAVVSKKQQYNREAAPQQLMNPPAPLMSSQQMPMHPSKNEQVMEDNDEMFAMGDDDNIENMMAS